jgi:hypothetical protein
MMTNALQHGDKSPSLPKPSKILQVRRSKPLPLTSRFDYYGNDKALHGTRRAACWRRSA